MTNIIMNVLTIFSALSWSALASDARASATACEKQGYRHEFLVHPDDSSRRVEYCLFSPDESKPLPAIILIHGHQPGERPGADSYVKSGLLKKFADLGYVTVAISQPGYGSSDGPPDFCGPYTQRAVLALVAHLRSLTFVIKEKVGLWGFSRGATVASMVATQDSQLAAVVLGSGVYDLAERYATLSAGSEMKKSILRETGATPAAFHARSALGHPDKIKVPLLIGIGGLDDVAPYHQGLKLAETVSQTFKDIKLILYPSVGHPLTPDWIGDSVSFLNKYLK